jgi:rhodanese-related sulfurtransferase
MGQADLSSLPKDQPVYLHCSVGGRARYAANVLKNKGYDARPLDLNPAGLAKAGFAPAP